MLLCRLLIKSYLKHKLEKIEEQILFPLMRPKKIKNRTRFPPERSPYLVGQGQKFQRKLKAKLGGKIGYSEQRNFKRRSRQIDVSLC